MGGARAVAVKDAVRTMRPRRSGCALVHTGVDKRDAHARALGTLMRARDAERDEVGLQVVKRIVVRWRGAMVAAVVAVVVAAVAGGATLAGAVSV